MKYKVVTALLASTLTCIGCVSSEPTTYGVKDRQWQAMSHEERQIAKKNYEHKQRETDHADNIVVAQNEQAKPKNSITLYSSSYHDHGNEKNKEQFEQDKPQDQVAALNLAKPSNDKVNVQENSTNEVNKVFTKEDAANLEQSKTHNSRLSLLSSAGTNSNGLDEQHLVRGNELIVNLQSKLGRQPLLSEMQTELQSNMNVSSRQARRIIDALGLY